MGTRGKIGDNVSNMLHPRTHGYLRYFCKILTSDQKTTMYQKTTSDQKTTSEYDATLEQDTQETVTEIGDRTS